MQQLMGDKQYEHVLALTKQLKLRIGSDTAVGFLYMGNAMEGLGFWEGAQECFRNAFEMNPHLPGAYYNYALCLFKHNEVETALDNLNLAIELRPTYHWAWAAKARLLLKMNRVPEARDCFTHAVELDPYNLELRKEKDNVAGN